MSIFWAFFDPKIANFDSFETEFEVFVRFGLKKKRKFDDLWKEIWMEICKITYIPIFRISNSKCCSNMYQNQFSTMEKLNFRYFLMGKRFFLVIFTEITIQYRKPDFYEKIPVFNHFQPSKGYFWLKLVSNLIFTAFLPFSGHFWPKNSIFWAEKGRKFRIFS